MSILLKTLCISGFVLCFAGSGAVAQSLGGGGSLQQQFEAEGGGTLHMPSLFEGEEGLTGDLIADFRPPVVEVQIVTDNPPSLQSISDKELSSEIKRTRERAEALERALSGMTNPVEKGLLEARLRALNAQFFDLINEQDRRNL